MTSPSGPPAEADPPQRVSTFELFFDLVFVFTITQLTSSLARDVTLAAAGRLLLVFGVLWWMYGGYAWLTNERTPSLAPERLLLLVGMAGFLVIGLSVPHAFGPAGSRGRRAQPGSLAAWPVSVAVASGAVIALLTVVVAAALTLERRAERATVEA